MCLAAHANGHKSLNPLHQTFLNKYLKPYSNNSNNNNSSSSSSSNYIDISNDTSRKNYSSDRIMWQSRACSTLLAAAQEMASVPKRDFVKMTVAT